MPARRLALLGSFVLASVAGGCVEPGGEDDGADAGSEGANTPVDPLVVPTEGGALLAWLQAEPYLDWPGESAIHASTGPHFGNVRTWLHPDLVDSLEAGEAMHPAGVGTVKELYGDGMARRGWSVSVKRADDSAGGDGWYWYEVYDDSVLADADGLGLCTGCHGGGVDYVLTPYPLQ